MVSASQFKGLEFYKSLAKLFYAIAAADKVIKEEEFNALKKSIIEDWLTVQVIKDEFNANPTYQMKILIDWVDQEQKPKAEKYYNDFVTFKNKHPELFSTQIKHIILKTAGRIAGSFSRTNKSELIMLAKLDIELKKIPE